MTQAFNLSQLANGVNTSGQLNAAANLYNQVPVANGGTNAASLAGNGALVMNAGGTTVTSVAAGASGNVLTSDGTTWTSATNVAGTSVNVMIVGTASGTWTKPATVKSIKVTVVGGGGNGGPATGFSLPMTATGGVGGGGGYSQRMYSAASLPGPQPYTVGGGNGASSFGVAPATVITGSAGGAGASAASPGSNPLVGSPGSGGAGSGGQINISGGNGFNYSNNITDMRAGTSVLSNFGNALLYGGGGNGGYSTGPLVPGTTGAAGVVIIEEFY